MKIECKKCNHWFASRGNNYKKHMSACNGFYKPPSPPQTNCVYCNESFDSFSASQKANHTRWCELNPKAKEYRDSLLLRRAKSQTEEAKRKAKEGIKNAWKRGCYDHVNYQNFLRKTHTEKAKQIIRQKALASNHRRLKKNTIQYKGVLLDSSWELALAERLDHLNIEWKRPGPVQWQDEEGVFHHYFPDFYLPVFDVYLDPKNPAAVRSQEKKINILKKLLPNLTILETLQDCENYTPVSQLPSKQ